MSGLSILTPRGRALRCLTLSLVLAAILSLVVIAPAAAATVTSTWNATVGGSGANGSARIQAYSTGAGAATLKLVKLKSSALLPVVISKGTCGTAGATLMTLKSIKTTSAGAATRTSSLTAAQVKLIKAATKGSARIAIRIGTGTSRRCGLFTLATPPAVEPTVAATIPVGVYPGHLAIDATGIWVTNWYDNTVSRIDPASNSVFSVSSLAIPDNAAPEGVTSGFGSIWITVLMYDELGTPSLPGSVVRFDPATGSAIGAPIPVGRKPGMITASAEAIWITNNLDASVSRIDPLTNQVTATIPVGDSPLGIAAGFGSIWVANVSDGTVARIDPTTNQVTTTVQTQQGAFGLAVGAGGVWVSYCGCDGQAGVVSRIDPLTNTVIAATPVGTEAGFLTFGGGYAWAAVDGDNTVVQIDPATNAVKQRIPVGAKSWGIAASDHAVWVVHSTAAGSDPGALLPGTVTRISF
jgi:YVTN family beta-propeller protein